MLHTFSTSSFSPLRHKTDLHLHISTINTFISRSWTTNYGNDRVLIPAHRGICKSEVSVPRNNNPLVLATTTIDSAGSVVRKFYEGINRHDLASVEDLIAQNCIYEDLVFPRPFVGRKEILDFFKKFTDSISTDLQFAIDDISEEDTCAVGVTWHLGNNNNTFFFFSVEWVMGYFQVPTYRYSSIIDYLTSRITEWKGKVFPFSKGCSFYRLDVINGQRQIVYGRDSVEPVIKPGETALVAIRGVCWLLQKLPFLAQNL